MMAVLGRGAADPHAFVVFLLGLAPLLIGVAALRRRMTAWYFVFRYVICSYMVQIEMVALHVFVLLPLFLRLLPVVQPQQAGLQSFCCRSAVITIVGEINGYTLSFPMKLQTVETRNLINELINEGLVQGRRTPFLCVGANFQPVDQSFHAKASDARHANSKNAGIVDDMVGGTWCNGIFKSLPLP